MMSRFVRFGKKTGGGFCVAQNRPPDAKRFNRRFCLRRQDD
jgi:hypothetical protein